jgi:DNA helicase HerA-like ATPase
MSEDFEIPDGPDLGDETEDSTEPAADGTVSGNAPPPGGAADIESDDETGTSQPSGGITEQSVPSDSPDLSDGEVGHILGSKEIRVGRTEYTVEAYITTDRRNALRVGDYVRVPYRSDEESLFAAVAALRYEPYTDLDDTSDTHNQIVKNQRVDESEHVLVAELEPIASVPNDGDDRGIVNRIPKPDAPVTLAEDEAYLRTGLNIPHNGVFCGYLSVGGDKKTVGGDPLPYYLSNPGSVSDGAGGYEIEDGEPAIWRHLLVAGTTGKGKTHFTKNLLRQFIGGKRYPVSDTEHKELGAVILDPANEYWEMMHDNDELNDDRADRLRTEQGLNVGGLGDNLQVFVPQVENTNDPATDRKTPFTVPFSVVKGRPQLLMPYKPTPVTRGALEDCLTAYFDDFERAESSDSDTRPPLQNSAGESPKYAEFLNFLDRNSDEESRLRQEANIGSGTWSAIMRRVKSTEFNAVFDGDANRLDEQATQMFKPGQVTVIPTRHLSSAKESLVVLSVLSYIIQNKLKNHKVDPNVSETPLLVGVDEAHNYLSSPSSDDLRGQYIVDRAREAVKQGRKDQLGLMMITQNPEDIDGDILKQTNTNVFLGLRDEVVEKVPSVPQEYTRDIPKFGKGQAAVKAPDVEAAEVVGLDTCLTQHGER